MDILVESLVLAQYQQNDQRHVNVVGGALRRIVQRLEDRNYLSNAKKGIVITRIRRRCITQSSAQ